MYKIILNPFAGKGKAFRKLGAIEKYFRKYEMDYKLSITSSPRQAIDFAREAVNEKFLDIIAAGGDGTINETLNGIMQSENKENVNLGLIAVGGGNDFVKNLDYPKRLKHQIKILKNKKTKKIDIGKIENYYFVNTLGIGFDAQVAMSYRNNKILNGFPGYIAAVMKTLVKNKTYEVEIDIDGISLNQKVKFVTIGNGICCGGKFHLTPDAKIDDGIFDICIIDPVSRRRILKLLPKAVKGKHTNYEEVKIIRGIKITIRSEQELPIYMDGELPDLKDKKNISIELIPQKINLIVN